MKSFKMFASLLAASVLLAACALIPPQPIGADVLGYDGEIITVGSPVIVTGFSTLANLGATEQHHFSDIEPPDMPIAPSSLQAVQGFEDTLMNVTHATSAPPTVTITSGTFEIVVSDDLSGDSVSASSEFGPLTLNREDGCTGQICQYSFADPESVVETLTTSVSGNDLATLLSIISEGGPNTISLNLDVETAEDIASIEFTIDVQENYIRF